MEDFIRKLFSESNFKSPNTKGRLLFFSRTGYKQIEYFLVDLIDGTELETYLESEKIDEVLSFFEDQKSDSADIEKNTSLLVLTKVDKLNQEFYDLFKRHIWRIEENEYFFNKSVILYEESILDQFNLHDSLISQVEKKITNEEFFTVFAKNYFSDLLYLFCIQLYIKIPFLEIPLKKEQFDDLQSLIDSKLTDFQLYLKDKLSEELIDDLSELRDNFLDTSDKSIDEFLNKFIPKDETD